MIVCKDIPEKGKLHYIYIILYYIIYLLNSNFIYLLNSKFKLHRKVLSTFYQVDFTIWIILCYIISYAKHLDKT